MYSRIICCFVAMLGMLVYLDSSESAFVCKEINAEINGAMASAIQPYLTQCFEEFSFTEEQVDDLIKNHNVDEVDPCFLCCFFKKTGHIDDNGMYDVDKAMELNSAFVKNEEARDKRDDINKKCATVNDEEVSDGEAGCERARKLVQCYIEHNTKKK